MTKKDLSRWLFGDVTFPNTEEYDEFRYKFLIALMLFGALFTALFVLGEVLQINRIQTPHLLSMQLFTLTAFGLWVFLRGHKQRFKLVAWIYEIVCLMEYTSSLWFVPGDELRLMWFFVNIPGVFLVLGSGAGWLITWLTIIWLLISNSVMPVRYSSNAMATIILSSLYMAVFFHVYRARSLSYFRRMRDYNNELEKLASHDMLTGVLNTRAYYDACEQHIQMASRTGQPYAVIFLDLDHFKAVNDTYGHAAGDAVLKAVATCLKTSIRKSDTLGRIGGEEFSVFMPNTGRNGAMCLAELLRAAIEDLHPSIGDRRLRVTASMGVAVCDSMIEEMPSLQHKADQAMYAAKTQGRNRVCAFDSNTPLVAPA